MTSYPFDSVWHPGRGIVFSRRDEREDVVSYPKLNMTRRTFVTATDRQTANDAEQTQHLEQMAFELDLGESDGKGASSFATAPEHADDVPAGAAQAPRPETTLPKTPVQLDNVLLSEGPPHTSLDFNVCEGAFNSAKQAPEGSVESYWSYTLYRCAASAGAGAGAGEGASVSADKDGAALEDGRRVKVHYCKSIHTMERVCSQYFADEEVLGFDMEWQPNATRLSGPRRNCSLIQIASPSRIALFHVALFPAKPTVTDADSHAHHPHAALVSPAFRRLMEDPRVTKAGVNIKGDATRLRNFLGVDMRGVFEVSHLYKLVKYSASGEVGLINRRAVSMATLVEECLGLPLFKGTDVRSSDWSQKLELAQVSYSASDAYAGLQLYHVLDERRQSLVPTPPRPSHAELNQPIRLAEGVTAAAGDTTEATETCVDDDVGAAEDPDGLNPTSISRPCPKPSTPVKAKPKATKFPKLAATPSPSQPQRDSRVLAAEARGLAYRTSRAKTSAAAAPSAIRSYFLWNDNEGLRPEEMAGILREPPLRVNTVVGYILEAVRLEGLPFDGKRMRNEVLHLAAREVLEGKYAAVVRKAHGLDG